MSQARVYSKTEAGLDEVQSRQAGLNARVRQRRRVKPNDGLYRV
jgi:hypothetical protein